MRRGAPVLVEIGPRDAAGGKVSFMRRDALRDGDKVKSEIADRDAFIAGAPALLEQIQANLFNEARARLADGTRDDITSFEALESYFGAEETDEFRGWVKVGWARPGGAELEHVSDRLKALKLTIRNAPLDQPRTFGKCVFTGAPAVEQVIVSRAY